MDLEFCCTKKARTERGLALASVHKRALSVPLKSLSLLFLLAIAGCNQGVSQIKGTWITDAGGAHSEYHFFADGRFTMQSRIGATIANVEGMAKVDGDRLVLSPSTSKVEGGDPQMVESMRKSAGQTARVPMRRDNPMTFTLTMGDGEPGLTFHRMSDQP